MREGLLETQRLRLRPLTDDDLPALCAILQDPVAMRAYEHAFSDEEAREWLARQQRRRARDGLGLMAVCLKDTGEMVGQCGVTWQDTTGATPFGDEPGPGSRVLEVGYLFQRAHWHKGYAAEAARACRDWAFSARNAQAVYSIIREGNDASVRVALRQGMKPAGRLVKHYRGIDMPHTIYRVTRTQWLRLRGQAPELWDVYDKAGRRTGRTIPRGSKLAPGQYFMAVSVTVLTPDGQVLLTRRSPEKQPGPNLWEVSGGAALAGETAAEAACRELCEETGLVAFPRQLRFLGTERRYNSFMEQYLLRRPVALEGLMLQPGETCGACLVPLARALELARGGTLDGAAMTPPDARRMLACENQLRAALEEQAPAETADDGKRDSL